MNLLANGSTETKNKFLDQISRDTHVQKPKSQDLPTNLLLYIFYSILGK